MPVLAWRRVKSKIADAGRFAAGAGGRRNRDQRLERPGHRQALANRRVHVVEEVRRRIRRVEVDRLGGVDRRAAADGDERVERTLRARTRWRRGRTRRSARRARDRRGRTRCRCSSSDSAPSAPGRAVSTVGSVTTSTRGRPGPPDRSRLRASRPRRSGRPTRPSRTQCRASWRTPIPECADPTPFMSWVDIQPERAHPPVGCQPERSVLVPGVECWVLVLNVRCRYTVSGVSRTVTCLT